MEEGERVLGALWSEVTGVWCLAHLSFIVPLVPDSLRTMNESLR